MSIYFRQRLSEYGSAFVILSVGLLMFFSPASLHRPGMGDIAESAAFFTISCIVIGVARVIALVINGHWRRTPSIRFVGSCLGVGIYSALLLTFISASQNSISFGIPLVLAWLILDLINAVNTISDMARQQKYR